MIVVNPATRQFNIPGADLVFGVTADANSAIKHFQCPRYVGNNVDIASSFVRINYQNAHGDIDFYLVNDVTVDGDNVTFSWELHPKVTMYRGNVSFVMCVTGPDAKVKWHTTLGRGQVLEGLEPDSTLVETDTKDGIAALISMVEAQTVAVEKTGADQVAVVKAAAKTAQDGAVAHIEAKGASTLATIPGEYTATVNAVQSAANAIRGKVSGEVIRVDDVSPMEHYPKIWVHGKNLIPYPYKQSASSDYGGTFVAQADGGVLASGTPTGYASLSLYEGVPLVKSGKVILSCSGDSENISLEMAMYDAKRNMVFYRETSESLPPVSVDLDLYPLVTSWVIYLKRNASNVEMRGVAYPQLEVGEVATEYAPYIDPTTVTVTRCGKNLFPVENLTLTQSSGKGVVENDVLTITGYLLSYRLRAPSLVGKTITFSCESTRSGEKGGGLSIECRDADNVRMTSAYKQNELSPTVTLVVAKDTADIMLFFYAAGSQTETGTAVYRNIQLEVSDTASFYEPYSGETQIPAADGTITGLRAISPTMTLLTDTPGVTIDCEYSRDTNKVIEDILNKLAALTGNT